MDNEIIEKIAKTTVNFMRCESIDNEPQWDLMSEHGRETIIKFSTIIYNIVIDGINKIS